MRPGKLAGALLLAFGLTAAAAAGDGNRLAYLDGSDPFYPTRSFPKLVTPQWVGDEGVEAVVILSIDDMRGPEKWEAFLRPVLERLKAIDGRAPVSIMTCQVDPRHPQLQEWLDEGLSLEAHTFDHPCPLLQKGDFAAAVRTYEKCVDQMDAIPGSHAVAFRMPCCDSLNSSSPRFFAEILDRTTAAGNFLEIDSSVFNIITANDPELPRELVLDAQSQEIFRRYVPFENYALTIEDYPYPYVIGRSCWEFPCVVPSDWSAQHVQQPNNPRTVEDWKRALDATVVKQGVFTLVFHPHGWIQSQQLIELIDHAVEKHGPKVKFLTFREAADRLKENLLAGQTVRSAEDGDNGVRLLDVNSDGYTDVVIGNDHVQQTRLWSPDEGRWQDSTFPARLAGDDAVFGVMHDDGSPTVWIGGDAAWHFVDVRWMPEPKLALGEISQDEKPRALLRDLDGDGICELLLGSNTGGSVFAWRDEAWQKLPFALPEGVAITDPEGDEAGLRLVDIDQDGRLDVLFSNDERCAAYLFVSLEEGWARKLVAGNRGDVDAIPMIARAGTNNGAWIHRRTLLVQNEDTAELPDLVERMPLDDLLVDVLFPGPKSPEQSLAVTHARPGFQVELMAAEPLVADPIAIAFGPDGKLWVVEMGDYPRGIDGEGGKGGRVRYLEDTDGDGQFDKSTLFLDDLGYPNGIAPWREGMLVSCAPDILYAEDTDGDGRADKREVLYTGFLVGNPQHRMNGFKWGMDGWLYAAHGDAVGRGVKLVKRDERVDANHRDFRIRPDEGLLDPQTGVTQYGRNRDDWGNWFGNSNSNPLYQFVLADHYLRRNELVASPGSRVDVPEQAGAAEVFPRSRTLARFNDLYAANRFTSANSSMIYRDDLFGPAFHGNAFVSEPVHNLVHREVVRREGLRFRSRRAADERESEFLASADNWFRPASLVTGPDGALWVADMYRQTIEHPEWIPQSVQDQIDLRAGGDMGRIYRVYPVGVTPRPIPRLDTLSTQELVAALDNPSGWQRDMVQQLLVWRDDRSAIEPLRKLAAESELPACRAQALWTLSLLVGLQTEDLTRALEDEHSGVRRQAIEIAEPQLEFVPQIGQAILALASDDDPHVQLQRAYTLGEWKDPRAGQALGELALRYRDDEYMTAAVLSSVNRENLYEVVARVLDDESAEPPAELLEKLVSMASAFEDERSLAAALARIAQPTEGDYAAWQMTALAGLLEALDRADASWHELDAEGRLAEMFSRARATVAHEDAADESKLRAIRLLGHDASHQADDIEALVALLVPQSSGQVQTAAVAALVRMGSDDVPEALLAGWKSHGPELRSEVLDGLLAREDWTKALLAAVESGQVPAADIDAARRQRLQQSEDEQIKSQAAELLAGEIESNRTQVLAEHQGVLDMSGDAAAGAAVFKKRCAVCHLLRGVGTEVGPNLASLTDYSPQALLTALLDPNKAVEAKYRDYLAVTTSGLSYNGLLASETGNSVTLKGQEGKQQTILRTDLEALQATGKSLMPEGLEKDLSPADLANVIAYLRGSGAPRKEFYANHPQLVTPTTDGTLQLYPTTCEIYGPTIVMEPLFKALGEWQSENDRAVWNVELPEAGRYQMVLNYACLDDAAGNTWLLEAGDAKLTGQVTPTGSLDRFQETPCGEITLPAGKQQIILRSDGPIEGKLMQFGGVLLKPLGK
ncbi:MAG: dehydrogenase [Planctomycetota bacterium]|nr:MAG: dehydrogenase [Planctomycetota bacterium]